MFKQGALVKTSVPWLVWAGAVLSASGCVAPSSTSASGGGASGTTKASTAAPGGAGVAGAGQTTQSTQTSGGQAAGASGCLTADIRLTVGGGSPAGAAGSYTVPIILENTGTDACTVHGWPGVAALNSGGTQVYQAMRVGPETAQITLQPGGTAAAVLYAVTTFWPPSSGNPTCSQVPNLLVTPPNETHSAHLQINTSMCVAPALSALSPGSTAGDSALSAGAFAEAQQLWKAGAGAISAVQGAYWTEAAAVLSYPAGTNAPGSTGFSAAAQKLTQLAGLPDAMQNPTQQSESHADTAALNSFFDTPSLYS
ncbi:DUF4232 domain-containing protein [Actinospica durhamensis]|uniref:DUF4232 domain-containing protein n=1 Tax=Actinospica durhamensis TaxID=1508375 RepID=A0A941EU46_9ACTN|nr:DUF4232 domain-containing protein [Actinospica durhamensis]MBR7837066.1 DUF4232 domain-containing protein [Actinospica durhamensis]